LRGALRSISEFFPAVATRPLRTFGQDVDCVWFAVGDGAVTDRAIKTTSPVESATGRTSRQFACL
jgi:hypothetical protein